MRKIAKTLLCSLIALSTVASLASCGQTAEGFEPLVEHVKTVGTFTSSKYTLDINDELTLTISMDDAEVYEIDVNYEIQESASHKYEFNWEICSDSSREAVWSFEYNGPAGKYHSTKHSFGGNVVAQDYSVAYDFTYDTTWARAKYAETEEGNEELLWLAETMFVSALDQLGDYLESKSVGCTLATLGYEQLNIDEMSQDLLTRAQKYM